MPEEPQPLAPSSLPAPEPSPTPAPPSPLPLPLPLPFDLEFSEGALKGRRLPFAQTGIVTIGRSTSNVVMIRSDGVSARHLVIEWREDHWILFDCHSTNGVKVNNERLVDHRQLQDGDLLSFAGNICRFHCAAAKSQSPTTPPVSRLRDKLGAGRRSEMHFPQKALEGLSAEDRQALESALAARQKARLREEKRQRRFVNALLLCLILSPFALWLNRERLGPYFQERPQQPRLSVEKPSPPPGLPDAAPASPSALLASHDATKPETQPSLTTFLPCSSEPAGALVEINGSPLGVTPLNLPLGTAPQEVSLLLGGYLPKRFLLDPGDSQPRHFRLKAAPGSLILGSEPSGASILIGGQLIGETPMVMPDQAFRRHEFIFRKTGFEDAAYQIVLTQEKPHGSITHRFAPITATIALKTRPGRCVVAIDGAIVGETLLDPKGEGWSLPLDIPRLLPGSHEVRIRPIGGDMEFKKKIDLKPKEVQPLEIEGWIIDTMVQLRDTRKVYGMLLKRSADGGITLAETPGKSSVYAAGAILDVGKATIADKYGFSRGIEVKRDRFEDLLVTIWNPAGSDFREALAKAPKLAPLKASEVDADFKALTLAEAAIKYRNKTVFLSGTVTAVRKGGDFVSLSLDNRCELYFRADDEMAGRLLKTLGKEINASGFCLGFRGLDRLVVAEASMP
ncbi:MAG: hypothetical protein RL095_3648 [Verrucomicrobiota bacterium]